MRPIRVPTKHNPVIIVKDQEILRVQRSEKHRRKELTKNIIEKVEQSRM